METLPFKDFYQQDSTQAKPGLCHASPLDYGLEHNEIINRIRLYRSQNVGPIMYRNLLLKYGTAHDAIQALPELASRGGRKTPLDIVTRESIEREWENHQKIGAKLIVEGDGIYPRLLSDLDEAPPVFSILGNPDLMQRHAVGVVGARNCSLNGKKIAYSLSKGLADAGFVVVSGLARGIDGQAHQASLEQGTIAIIAGGVDKIYPTEHTDLYHKIREQGLIIAESPLGVEPQSNLFPRRNRLISALSQGVVVIEAAMQSGSLITARYAIEQNKEVFVVPGSPLDPRYRGSNQLIRKGAHLTTSATDVIDVLQEPYRAVMKEAARDLLDSAQGSLYVVPSDSQESSEIDMGKLTSDLLESLSPTPISVDEVVENLPYAYSDIMTVMLELELAGRMTRHPGSRISL